MSSQGYAYWERRMARDRETEVLEQKSKRDEEAKWNTQALLASVVPSGSDRIMVLCARALVTSHSFRPSAIVKLIPKEVRTHLQNDTTLDITYRTMDQVRDAMLAEGMTPKLISDIEKMLPVPIHHEEEPATDEEAYDDVELLDRGRA